MASDRELRTWVADQLHGLVGFSDKTIADFILAKAKTAKDPVGLVSSLAAVEVPSNPSTKAFAAELLSRLPQSRGGLTQSQAAHKQAAAFARRNRAYDLLDGDEEDAAPAPQQQQQQQSMRPPASKPAVGPQPPPAAVAGPGPGSSGRHLRQRHVGDGDDDDDTVVRSSKRQKRRWEEDGEEGAGGQGDTAAREEARREAEREADQREKEEFEARWVGQARLTCALMQYGVERRRWLRGRQVHNSIAVMRSSNRPKRQEDRGGCSLCLKQLLSFSVYILPECWSLPAKSCITQRASDLHLCPLTCLVPLHVDRLREKDEARTKKKGDKASAAEEEEAAKRRYNSAEERQQLLPALRDMSRQQYLAMREEQKLQELKGGWGCDGWCGHWLSLSRYYSCSALATF